jgi:anti-sigma factor RsiW
MRRHSPEMHLLTGAYALDALDDAAERERVARHLERCDSCAAEATGMREVATALAFAASAPPPPAMRGAVLAATARTRQLPPLQDRAGGNGRKRWGSWRLVRRSAPAGQAGRLGAPGPAGRAWMPRLAGAVAAVAVAAAVALGIVTVNAEHELHAANTRQQAIAAVLTAPDARIVGGPVSSGGRATVVVSSARRQLVVTLSGLRALPKSKVYELWLLGPPRTRPAGLIATATARRSGRLLASAPLLASGLAPGDKLGLTVEPAGGTAQPTTAPILVLPLTG